MTRSYIVSDDNSLVADAHKLLNEVDKITNRGQKCIQRLLRRLGMLLEGSETSSLENKDVGPGGTPLRRQRLRGEIFLSGGDLEGTTEDEEGAEQGQRRG